MVFDKIDLKGIPLIGMAGKAGSGKDLAAAFLAGDKLSFAAPLKEAVLELLEPLGVTPDHIYGEYKEEIIPMLGKSAREVMQTFGTNWARDMVHKDLWLMLAYKRIETYIRMGSKVIIVTDVRFQNEKEMIKSIGGHIWHIKRDTGLRLQDSKLSGHESENGLRIELGPQEREIDNTGSVADLRRNVLEAFNAINKQQ